jgi:CubicO group peptidase (beta-lactamase class C family)
MVTSLAALRMVESGSLDLDEDVNRRLTSWRVPESDLTREQKVTVRRILTHTAGTTDHGFPGYEPGAEEPTLLQVLDGQKPADTPPIRVSNTPGSRQSYSGGGFLILQQLMVDAAHEPFAMFVRQNVFDRLGLEECTYDPRSRHGSIASGRDRDGEAVPTRFGPELAVGGMWTTPSDLARIGIEMANSRNGRSNRILSRRMTQEMLRVQVNPQIPGAPAGDFGTETGLGVFIGPPSDPGRFEHSGVNVGFAARFLMWDSGRGIVIMINNWSFEGSVLMRYVTNAVAAEYGWSYRVPTFTRWPYANTVLLASAKLRGADAAIAEYFALKKESAEQAHRLGDLGVVWASDPPDYPPTQWDLYGLAKAIADPRRLADAIAIEKVETTEYPGWPEGFRYLAELCARSGDRAHAIEAYENVLRLSPEDQAARDALGRLRLRPGRATPPSRSPERKR